MKRWKVIVTYIDKQESRRASSHGIYFANCHRGAIQKAMSAWRDASLLTGNYRFEAEAAPAD